MNLIERMCMINLHDRPCRNIAKSIACYLAAIATIFKTDSPGRRWLIVQEGDGYTYYWTGVHYRSTRKFSKVDESFISIQY